MISVLITTVTASMLERGKMQGTKNRADEECWKQHGHGAVLNMDVTVSWTVKLSYKEEITEISIYLYLLSLTYPHMI